MIQHTSVNAFNTRPTTQRLKSQLFKWLTLAVIGLSAIGSAQAQLTGAGSSLVRDLMARWSEQHAAASGGMSYDAVGSSAGVSRVREQSVDFGVSDIPLTGSALQQAGLRQVPLAGAAVAIIINLPELNGRPVKLTGDILSEIYGGSITQWNHSQLTAVNPGLPLPNRAIVPIWRADGSGQSYVLSTYLSRYNSKWRRTPGPTSSLALSVGRGVRGGQAMIEALKSTVGAIGYESLGAAQSSGLVIAEMRNASDRFVGPSVNAINEAVTQARWLNDSLSADLDGGQGAGSYPLSAIAYALVPVTPRAGKRSALPFLQAAISNGDAQVRQTGFVPLPANAKTLVGALR
jgi:phosphate transport system substrate-binding protein